MLKDILKRKFSILILTIFIFLLTIIFPEYTQPISNNEISYNNNIWPLYITNKDKIVSRINVMIKENDILEKAKEIISYLTIDSTNTIYLPDSFLPIIPPNTTINNIKIDNNILIIDFSKELLNINQNNSRLLLECLVYSLLEIDTIEGIIIYVDNNLLTTVPNTKEKITLPLTRKIGTNIINNISNIKNTTTTTSYYLAKEKNYSYLIPVTTMQNSNKNKIEIVIEELKSHPHIKTNLISYLNTSTILTNYEILEEEIKLSFNNLLDEEITEETTYALALSFRDTLNIDKIEIVKSPE